MRTLGWFCAALLLACGQPQGEDDDGSDGGCHETADCPSDSTSDSGSSTDSTTDDDASTEGDETGWSTSAPTDVPPPLQCDLWAGAECPEGQKCTMVASTGSDWDSHVCVSIMGEQQVGEPCEPLGPNPGADGIDDCEEGTMCWDIDADTHIGYCTPLCSGNPNNPQCPDGHLCPVYGNGWVAVCHPICDPTGPPTDCPNPDNLCTRTPDQDGFICNLNASGGMGHYGTGCQFANSYNYGLFCAQADAVPGCEGQGCCSEYCDINEPNTCAGIGQECVPWFEMGMAPAGFEHVGGCQLP